MTMQNGDPRGPLFDLGLFEGTPEGDQLIFNSFLPTGTNPFQANQFQGLFQPTFNSFLGALGQQIAGGQTPSLSFTQFLQERFNPQRALLQLPGSGATNQGGPTVFRF